MVGAHLNFIIKPGFKRPTLARRRRGTRGIDSTFRYTYTSLCIKDGLEPDFR